MVTFTQDFVERMKKRMEFYVKADEQGLKGSLEVLVVKGDNLLAEASTPGGDVTWFSDEPRAQGGSGKGVSPLAYFLSSLGLCQMVHYAEHAATKGIDLASLSMRVRGRFSLAHPRGFEEITYRVDIQSPSDPDRIARLARAAAEDCYVTQTLRRTCQVRGEVYLNGRLLLELT